MGNRSTEVEEPLAVDNSIKVNFINPISTALLDDQLTFIQMSSDFGRMIGADNEQLVGTHLTDVLWEFVGVEEYLQAIIRGHSDRFLLENIQRALPGGMSRYLSFQISSSLENPESKNLLLIVEDRTDVNQLQQSLIQDRNELRLARSQLTALNAELAQLNHLKSLFLSMAAHDLRTPLSSIQGYAELLREELAHDESRQRDLFDVILSQAYRLQHLINDLLDLDQIERGELRIIFRECWLNEIIEEVAMAMRPLALRAGIDFEVSGAEDPFPIEADPQRIAQILYNLMGNALKYTPAGGHVRLLVTEMEDSVEIVVQDDGPGISESNLQGIFDPYFAQGRKNARTDKSGTGLGLYIVNSLVEAHHGQVTVSSGPAQGTTFTVVLPLILQQRV